MTKKKVERQKQQAGERICSFCKVGKRKRGRERETKKKHIRIYILKIENDAKGSADKEREKTADITHPTNDMYIIAVYI